MSCERHHSQLMSSLPLVSCERHHSQLMSSFLLVTCERHHSQLMSSFPQVSCERYQQLPPPLPTWRLLPSCSGQPRSAIFYTAMEIFNVQNFAFQCVYDVARFRFLFALYLEIRKFCKLNQVSKISTETEE